ncbi:calcium-binding protein [Phormidium tenue FACHB-886]|nr:calcium-binding protein [Phormidium tenue FACHB-886]
MVNIFGNSNNNILTGGVGNDNIFGRGGTDTLRGLAGDDSINGGAGSDLLQGGADNDMLDGGTGNDTLLGGRGDDVLIGGDGNNILTGGRGQDAFKLDSVFGVNTTIADFSVTNDVIQIDRSQFFVFDPITGGVTNLPLGNLAGGKFNTGVGPAAPNDYFIYNPGTGALSFDRDGSGGAGFPTTQIAQLTVGLAMTNTNIVLV